MLGKREKIALQNGLKCLNLHHFALYTNIFLSPPAATLFVGEKINLKGGGEWSKLTIYIPVETIKNMNKIWYKESIIYL